jgi:hypothetical protein
MPFFVCAKSSIHRSPMKTETLEALLIDRALGALSPEVAELLDDYLIQNPVDATQANTLELTVKLARTATAIPNPSSSGSPPLDRVRKALIAQHRREFAWQLSKLAACLLLGLTIGLAIQHAGTTAAAPNSFAASAGPIAATEAATDAGGRTGFWSMANFAQGRTEDASAGVHSDSRYRLRWDSLVKIPHLEGNL